MGLRSFKAVLLVQVLVGGQWCVATEATGAEKNMDNSIEAHHTFHISMPLFSICEAGLIVLLAPAHGKHPQRKKQTQ